MSLRELIAQEGKQAKKTPFLKPCPCPELPALDGQVFARGIGTDVYTSFVADIPTGRDPYVVVRPLLYSLCDKDGNRIYENDAMGLAELQQLPSIVTLRWRKISDSLNRDRDEDLEKKSEPAESSTAS